MPQTLQKSTADTPPSLDDLYELVKDDLGRVNQLILDRMESQVPLIPALAGHLVASGGKRLRPLLTLASARLCGYKGEKHIALAACVEFIHTATLLHDDVVDESTLRRGKASANALWGNQASVLVGDFLFSRSFQLMVEQGSLEVLEILAKASATISEGEVLQLTASHSLDLSRGQYLEVVASKTAALFEAACEIVPVLQNAPASQRKALAAYGLSIGIAFQLMDDVLDYSASQEKLGKTIGDDLREGKITLPVILAYEAGGSDEKNLWQRLFEDRGEEALKIACSLLQKHGALNSAVKEANRYVQEAIRVLETFDPSSCREALRQVALFVTARGY